MSHNPLAPKTPALLEAGNAFDEPIVEDAWWAAVLEEDAANHPAAAAKAA